MAKPPGRARGLVASAAARRDLGRRDGARRRSGLDPEGKDRQSSPPASATASGLPSSPRPASSGARPTSATGSATTSCPTTSPACKEGAFYGWPWYYIGGNEDPRHKGERPDLKGKVTVPDVLLQAHSAPLASPSTTATSSPPSTSGDAFVALHGSWNRGARTGYKVVRIRIKDGEPTGEYEDFMTGFVLNDPTSGAGRSASPSPRTARCWSARTATARSGGSATAATTARLPARAKPRECWDADAHIGAEVSMAGSYSTDLRSGCWRRWRRRDPRAAARRFAVGRSTAHRWAGEAREEGRRAAKRMGGGPPPQSRTRSRRRCGLLRGANHLTLAECRDRLAGGPASGCIRGRWPGAAPVGWT